MKIYATFFGILLFRATDYVRHNPTLCTLLYLIATALIAGAAVTEFCQQQKLDKRITELEDTLRDSGNLE